MTQPKYGRTPQAADAVDRTSACGPRPMRTFAQSDQWPPGDDPPTRGCDCHPVQISGGSAPSDPVRTARRAAGRNSRRLLPRSLPARPGRAFRSLIDRLAGPHPDLGRRRPSAHSVHEVRRPCPRPAPPEGVRAARRLPRQRCSSCRHQHENRDERPHVGRCGDPPRWASARGSGHGPPRATHSDTADGSSARRTASSRSAPAASGSKAPLSRALSSATVASAS